LREDNADMRLTEIGRTLGLGADQRWKILERKGEAVGLERERLKSTWLNTRLLSEQQMQTLFGQNLERDYTFEELLRRPGVHYRDLISLPGAGSCLSDDRVAEQVEIQIKYHGYIERQRNDVSQQEQFESTRLPVDLD